jgi:hypothetical protein
LDVEAFGERAGQYLAGDLYENCEEKNRDGQQISTGENCVRNAILYMIEALQLAPNPTEVMLLSSTIDNVQRTTDEPSVNVKSTVSSSSLESLSSAVAAPPLKLKRQDESAREGLWAELNDQIRRRSEGGHRPRAVHIGHSELHPTDGLAVRTNVRSGDATLHVHTNGSHATAAFTKDPIPPLGRREAASTSGPLFQFHKGQGLKLQIRISDEVGDADKKSAYDDLGVMISKTAVSKDGEPPMLSGFDTIVFAMCTNMFYDERLRGKLVAEDIGAGNEWEMEGLIGCGPNREANDEGQIG